LLRVIRDFPDSWAVEGIFGLIEARCNEIRSHLTAPAAQIAGLAALNRWNSSLGLHQGAPLPSSLVAPDLSAPDAGAGGARKQEINDRIS
jgi:hypothetical protein